MAILVYKHVHCFFSVNNQIVCHNYELKLKLKLKLKLQKYFNTLHSKMVGILIRSRNMHAPYKYWLLTM